MPKTSSNRKLTPEEEAKREEDALVAIAKEIGRAFDVAKQVFSGLEADALAEAALEVKVLLDLTGDDDETMVEDLKTALTTAEEVLFSKKPSIVIGVYGELFIEEPEGE